MFYYYAVMCALPGKIVPEVTYCLLSGMLNLSGLLTQSLMSQQAIARCYLYATTATNELDPTLSYFLT